MENITNQDVRCEEAKIPRGEIATARHGLIPAAAIGIKSHGSSQNLPAATDAGTLAVFHPHVWAESLKLHGISELNSPLAG